jgi:hypothetical protein
MAVTKGAAGLGGLCCGILAWAVVGSAWAQDERPRLRAARGAPDAARAEPPSG